MVKRSFDLWHQLQAEDSLHRDEHGRGKLFHHVPNLQLIPTREEAEHEQRWHRSEGRNNLVILPTKELQQRFPALHPPPQTVGLLDPSCLGLLAARCLQAFQDKAGRHGAVFYTSERVVTIDRGRRLVQTDCGREVRYAAIVLASGPWTNRTLGVANLPLLPLFVSAEQLLYLLPERKEELQTRYSSPHLCIVNGYTNFTVPVGHGHAGLCLAHTYTHVHTRMYIHARTRTDSRTHTHAHKYSHTCTHARTRTRFLPPFFSPSSSLSLQIRSPRCSGPSLARSILRRRPGTRGRGRPGAPWCTRCHTCREVLHLLTSPC